MIIRRSCLRTRNTKSLKKSASELAYTFKKFPQDLRSFMHIIKVGPKVHVDVEADDLKYFILKLGFINFI